MLSVFPDTGSFKCTMNLAKLSVQSPTPELPLSSKKKNILVRAHYAQAVQCQQLQCGVDKFIDKESLIKLVDDNAVPVSFPVEHLHAWWAGFAQAVHNDDEVDLKQWYQCALTSTVHFKHMVQEDLMWNSMQHREDIATDYEVFRCTPLMRVLNFGSHKLRTEAKHGKLSADEHLKRYKTHLQLSERSEKLSANWVDQACTFLNRMYIIPQVAKLLLEAEELPSGTNPLEGTSKLQAVIQRARTPDKILRVVETIMDARKSGVLKTVPALSLFLGQQPGSGGKGLVEVILFKWDVAHYILHEWAQSQPLPAEVLITLKTIFASVSSYRTQCGYPGDKRDQTFRAGWRPSCEELFIFIEAVIFDTIYDAHLKECLKSSAQPADCVANQFSEFIDNISTMATKETEDRTQRLYNLNNF